MKSINNQCYLTISYLMYGNIKDNKLLLLKKFINDYFSNEDKEYYYCNSQLLIDYLNRRENGSLIYKYIYETVVISCIKDIEEENYERAYNRIMSNIIILEEQLIKPALIEQLVNNLVKKL